MLVGQVIKNTIDELSQVTHTEYRIYDDSLRLIYSSETSKNSDIKDVKAFMESSADSQIIGDDYYFKVKDEEECVYLLIASSVSEDANIMGKVAVCQLKSLIKAYKEKLDKTSFYQNLILDNMLLVDIHNRATKLHIENEVKRIVYLIETRDTEGVATEILKSLFLEQAGNIILTVDDQNIILIKDVEGKDDRESLNDTAVEILDILKKN